MEGGGWRVEGGGRRVPLYLSEGNQLGDEQRVGDTLRVADMATRVCLNDTRPVRHGVVSFLR